MNTSAQYVLKHRSLFVKMENGRYGLCYCKGDSGPLLGLREIIDCYKKTMKFQYFAGGASTTAWRNGQKLGSNVSVAIYKNDCGAVEMRLESNGRCIGCKNYTDFDFGKLDFSRHNAKDMQRALEMFGCETAWSNKKEDEFSH